MIHVFALLFATGILGLLPFQCHRRIRRGFFQLVSGLGFLATLITLGTSPRPLVAVPMAHLAVTIALLFLAFIYGCFMWSGQISRARALSWSFLPVALAALALTGPASFGSSLPGGAHGSRVLSGASFIAGAGLLGSVTLALLLGHWYLYSPGLPVSHLRRVTTLAAVSVAARFLAFIALLPALIDDAFGRGQAHPGTGAAFRLDAQALLESNLPLVAMRFLIGIVFPGILAWMIDRTVRLRSTQAATGLLYVSFIFVLFGELMATYLFAVTGVLA